MPASTSMSLFSYFSAQIGFSCGVSQSLTANSPSKLFKYVPRHLKALEGG